MLLDRDKSLIDKPRECISSRCTLFFSHFFFFVHFSEYIRVFLVNYALFTHNRRTINALFTHNTRTISAQFLILPRRKSVSTPYALRPTLSLLLRLPFLLLLLYLPLFHRENSERRPRDDRETTERRAHQLPVKKSSVS